MIDNNDSASSLPIKDEADLAIEARARQLMEQYDISMEEALRMARGEMLESMEAPPQQPPQPAAEARLAAQYQAAGMSPERAARIARNEAAMYGERGATAKATEQDSDYGRERLAGVAQQLEADDARHQQMYDNHFRATGAPSHQQIPAEEAARDEYRQRYNALFDSYRRDGVHSQQPIDPGTPEQNERWDAFLESNPEQMARFRPRDYATQQAAEADRRFAERRPLLVERYGEEEVGRMEAARRQGRAYVPNTADQRDNIAARQKQETLAMQGNTDAREGLARADRERFDRTGRPRQLRELGIAPDLRGPQLNAALGLDETATPSQADARIRTLLRDQRDAQKQAKDLLWRPRTMIRGGNAIGALALPGLTPGQEAAILGGPTPLAAQAVSAERAFQLLRASEVGQGLGGAAGAAQQMAQQAADYRRRQDAAAYADAQWARKPTRSRTTAARDRLARDIDNRFGPGTGVVAMELEVIDAPEQRAEGARAANATGVGPPANPINPGVPLAAPSRPPGV